MAREVDELRAEAGGLSSESVRAGLPVRRLFPRPECDMRLHRNAQDRGGWASGYLEQLVC